MQLAFILAGLLGLVWGARCFFIGRDSLFWLWLGSLLLLASFGVEGSRGVVYDSSVVVLGVLGGFIALVQRRLLRKELRRLEQAQDDAQVGLIRDGLSSSDPDLLGSGFDGANRDAL